MIHSIALVFFHKSAERMQLSTGIFTGCSRPLVHAS